MSPYPRIRARLAETRTDLADLRDVPGAGPALAALRRNRAQLGALIGPHAKRIAAGRAATARRAV